MLRRRVALAQLVAFLLLAGGCETFGHKEKPLPPPPPPGTPLPPQPEPQPETVDEAPLPVTPVAEPIVVAAWAEPKELPPGGGQVQILVRVQKLGGSRFPGVEVRLHSSGGSLYSASKVLVTDVSGMTRDRLTARKPVTITLNAGGTRYRFQVPVAESAP